MAYTKLYTTKDGKRYWKIEVSRGRGKSNLSTRFYWPDNTSKRVAERQLAKAVAEFELACEKGEVLSRKEKKEQEQLAAAEQSKIRTFRDYVDNVFFPTKEPTISETTRYSYRRALEKTILPRIGDFVLQDIKPADINKLILDYQKKGRSRSSCDKVYIILKGVFEMAYMDNTISFNPMDKVKRPAPRSDEVQKCEEEKSYTIEEAQYILSCMNQESLKWRTYVTLSIDTGARKGEICGLQWKDIDFTNLTVHFHNNLQYTPDKGIYVTVLKNKRERTIDIGAGTARLLKQLQNEQAEKCLSPWVFTHPGTSSPIHPLSPSAYFKKLQRKYRINDFHPHKLRHTYASIALTEGADVVSVASRLGHVNTAMTLKMYAHASQESIRKAGETARNAILNKTYDEAL